MDRLDRWQDCEETSGGTLREPSLYSRESTSLSCCVCALKRNDSKCGSFSRDFSLLLILLQSRRIVFISPMMTTTLNVNAIYIIIDQQASGGDWCQRPGDDATSIWYRYTATEGRSTWAINE